MIFVFSTEKVVVTCDTKEHQVKFKTNGHIIQEFIINLAFNFNIKLIHMEKSTYTAPKIEVLEIEIEQGFAASGNGLFNVPDGENWGDENWL